ncbi:MAG: diacylglycerol/lipid kinase family protein [Actinomycetota bacterium]
MSHPFGPMRVIVNPRAGRGAVQRGWPSVRDVLDEAAVDYAVSFTERPGHGAELARAAMEAGERYVVAVGGDGTVHEVVNGLMEGEGSLDSDTVLGVVAAGSGCDFVKTFGLPQDAAASARHLLGDALWGAIDVGRVSTTAPAGSRSTRWFANIAEAGLGAEVVAAAARLPRFLGGAVYKIAAVKEIARHEPAEATIRMRGRKARGVAVDTPLGDLEWSGPLTLLVVANCQFYGGGMKVAPRAIPADGMLDVQISSGSKGDALKVMQKISRGEHLPNPNIKEFLAERIEVEAPAPILVEADGEVLERTPAVFDVVPAALRLKI